MPVADQPKTGNALIIPREFSKSKEKIANLQGKVKAAEKAGAKGPAKKDLSELKKEVEMTVHKISAYDGLKEMAQEMGFTPPATMEEHLKMGLDPNIIDVSKSFSVSSFCLIMMIRQFVLWG